MSAGTAVTTGKQAITRGDVTGSGGSPQDNAERRQNPSDLPSTRRRRRRRKLEGP